MVYRPHPQCQRRPNRYQYLRLELTFGWSNYRFRLVAGLFRCKFLFPLNISYKLRLAIVLLLTQALGSVLFCHSGRMITQLTSNGYITDVRQCRKHLHTHKSYS